VGVAWRRARHDSWAICASTVASRPEAERAPGQRFAAAWSDALERGLLCWRTRSPAMHKFRRTLGATSLINDKVVNLAGHDIGRIEELMIDVTTGRVAYAVLSFGGFMGIRNKLFALPWSALTVDEAKKRFVVNVTRESLDHMPGFDKDHWPDLGDLEYATGVYRQWGATPYWA
jgi:sporulation protein YlmC with PRC-barrel domain